MRYVVMEILSPEGILPKMVYSEINAEEWEIRKIHLYNDGRVGYADGEHEVGNTGLGEKTIPSTAKLQQIDGIRAYEITKDEFERFWQKYVVGYTGEA